MVALTLEEGTPCTLANRKYRAGRSWSTKLGTLGTLQENYTIARACATLKTSPEMVAAVKLLLTHTTHGLPTQ